MRKIEVLHPYRPLHELFRLFRDEDCAVFLDSSLENKLGEYSMIGVYPYLKLQQGLSFTVNGAEQDCDFKTYLSAYLKEKEEKNNTGLPLVSGAIGYFSYDYGRKAEGLSSRHCEETDIPECLFCFYDVFLVEDIQARQVYLIANGQTGDSNDKIEELKRRIFNHLPVCKDRKEEDKEDSFSKLEVIPDFTEEAYLNAIEQMIDHIREGNIYIANMTQQLKIQSDREPYETFSVLRQINPSPFGGYFNYGDFQVISASPERFLKMADTHVTTRPIKGTRRRGEDAGEDLQMRQELEHSEKDKSELLMIVDLERNDLNKVCIPGTVQVTELFEIEEYATVFHLVASIEGDLRPGLTAMDLIAAAFPGGSITGAPKRRAMEIIDEVERSPRGLYTGTMGYFSLDGNCDFNIAIRTVLHRAGTYQLGVGGGITYESEPGAEYQEIYQKAKAILAALR